MIVGFSEFINTDPTPENISVLVSSSLAIGLTVSVEDCNRTNIQKSLSSLNSITIPTLNNGQPINIQTKTVKTRYFYLEIEPFSVTGSLSPDNCNTVFLSPFLEAIGFENSNFNVLFNNVTSSRASNYIQDVDRKRDSINPSNLGSILDGTALKASIPDSYYTSLAHTSGRYIGAKTSEEEYGISPALGVKFFEGAEYLTGVASGSICNELLSDRKLEVFVYSGNFDTPVNGNRIFRAEGNKALPLRNRQVWVRANTTIYITDGEGYVSNSGTLCSI